MVMRRAEVRIESIAAGGDGVARTDGLVLFIPRSAPGDRAVVEFPTGGRFARARMVELLSPSTVRVDAPCLHFARDNCGGCQLQHVGYDAQREAKSRIVADAIARIGKRERAAPPDVRPSPLAWRYRRKLTLAMRRRASRWIAGLHPYDAPGQVFALDDCLITEEPVLAVWRAILDAAETLPEVRELRGAVRLDHEGASFVLEGGDRWPRSGELFERVTALETVWWIPTGAARRLLHRRRAQAPGASFAQVNADVAAELRAHVLERIATYAPASVVDGYAGLGDTAVALDAAGVRVTAIELDRDAAAWCASRLGNGSRALTGRVEELLPNALPADVVLLNPPRAGVDERVTTILETARPGPRAVLYVSCDPATLARDLRRLPSWSVASLVSFDMFPQTAHVETVCELTPSSERA